MDDRTRAPARTSKLGEKRQVLTAHGEKWAPLVPESLFFELYAGHRGMTLHKKSETAPEAGLPHKTTSARTHRPNRDTPEREARRVDGKDPYAKVSSVIPEEKLIRPCSYGLGRTNEKGVQRVGASTRLSRETTTVSQGRGVNPVSEKKKTA